MSFGSDNRCGADHDALSRAARDAAAYWAADVHSAYKHTWFVTLTFASAISVAVAMRALKTWARQVAREAAGRRHFRLSYQLDVQPQSGRLHAHLLCSFDVEAHPAWGDFLWQRLRSQYPTGRSNVKVSDGRREVADYIFGQHRGEFGSGLVCPRSDECAHRRCKHGGSPWPKHA